MMDMSNFTKRYPALLSDLEVDALAMLANGITSGGNMVEIGSKIGGSAMIICEHARDLRMLHCIDPAWGRDEACAGDPWMTDIINRMDIDGTDSLYACAQRMLSPWDGHVNLLKMASPYEMSWWSEPVDFVFEDSSHANPQLHDNLVFWYQHLRSGGTFAGHDFDLRWPDVMQEVLWFTESKRITLKVLGTIWWFEKP